MADANLFDQALAFHRAGQLDQAEATYTALLAQNPRDSGALTNLATLNLQRGRADAAIQLLRCSLEIAPDQANACNLLACALKDTDHAEQALPWCDRAIALQPDYADAFSNRADVLLRLQQPERALADYDRAIALGQCYAETFFNRGNALLWLERLEDALPNYDRAIALRPSFARALAHRGMALARLHRPAQALADLDLAIALEPDDAEAFNNRGNALFDLGHLIGAFDSYNRAIALRPDYAEAFSNLGNVLQKFKRLEEAIACYDRAIALRPGDADARNHRGAMLYHLGRQQEALADYTQALAIDPANAATRWALALARIPPIFADEAEIRPARAAFAAALDALDAWFDDDEKIGKGADTVGNPPPFYLAYQEENNQPLLARYGALCQRLMADWQRRNGCESNRTPARTTGRIKVGIVSSHIINHSVWHALTKGWLQHLDRARFELLVFHLRPERDAETALAQSLADVFVDGHFSLKQWADAIQAQRADVLIYPEIGMFPLTQQLAALRLAPLQLAAWGHPETTGLPTIDAFISAEAFEPENADARYTEKLLRLPHLGCSYAPLVAGEIAETAFVSSIFMVEEREQTDGAHILLQPNQREARGEEQAQSSAPAPQNVPLLLCAGTPYKYAPQHDPILVEIARQLGPCRMIFFASESERALAERLRERLRRAFAAAGLDLDAVSLLLPWQDKTTFHALLRRADALLDTIGFSGFNTAMQAVECAAPIVTMEGRFMRGRLASGILRRIGLDELVAADTGAYIALALKLARDNAYRRDIKTRIEEARAILFNDPAPIRALEDFLFARHSG